LVFLCSFLIFLIGVTPTRPTLIFQGVSVSPSLAQRAMNPLPGSFNLAKAFSCSLKVNCMTAFSRNSSSFLLANRCQKLLREIFFPINLIKFRCASAIDFFLPQTEKLEIRETTSSKSAIFFPVESVHLFLIFCVIDSI